MFSQKKKKKKKNLQDNVETWQSDPPFILIDLIHNITDMKHVFIITDNHPIQKPLQTLFNKSCMAYMLNTL